MHITYTKSLLTSFQKILNPVLLKLAITIVSVIVVTGCIEHEGGRNTEESTPGNREEGNRLGVDLILSEDGQHLVTRFFDNNIKRFISFNLDSFSPVELDVAYYPDRMVFGRHGLGYFLSSNYDINDGIHYWLEEVSLDLGQVFRKWKFKQDYRFMTMDKDVRYVALWNTPSTDLTHEPQSVFYLGILDTVTGEVTEHSFEKEVVDAKWISGSKELAVVLKTEERDKTQINFYNIFEQSEKSITIPNCPSSLEISPDNSFAMLAPTDCIIDPVSVINLKQHKFIGNLPGFGPVVYSDDSTYAVAFARREDLKEEAGIKTTENYSLIFIDLPGLSFDVMELGNHLPIYTVTPDGSIVLLFSRYSDYYDNIVIVDVNGRNMREASGSNVELDEFVITPDSKFVYLIDNGFFKLDLENGQMTKKFIDCKLDNYLDTNCSPEILNITPDGETLIMGYMNEAEFILYDLVEDNVMGSFGQSSNFIFKEYEENKVED